MHIPKMLDDNGNILKFVFVCVRVRALVTQREWSRDRAYASSVFSIKYIAIHSSQVNFR